MEKLVKKLYKFDKAINLKVIFLNKKQALLIYFISILFFSYILGFFS